MRRDRGGKIENRGAGYGCLSAAVFDMGSERDRGGGALLWAFAAGLMRLDMGSAELGRQRTEKESAQLSTCFGQLEIPGCCSLTSHGNEEGQGCSAEFRAGREISWKWEAKLPHF